MRKAKGPSQSRQKPAKKRARKRLSFAIAVGISLSAGVHATPPPTDALPTGGSIVSGSGSISQSGSAMTVNQASNQMIANWSSFNIGSQASVNFVQPGSSSVALNRIAGGASQIFGNLTANGQVILINPNGIIFGQSAQVNVGGLVASTLDQSNANFLSGGHTFSGNGTGSIDNQGIIKVPAGGTVALIAPQVSNEGTIDATGGNVALAAGKSVTLDFAGDGLMKVSVDQAALDAEVQNKGVIIADGGLAVMTAKSANALMNTVVNNDGIVQANTLAEKDGHIILDGGDNGTVQIGGTVQANGTEAGQTGGSISVTGDQLDVAANAVVNASGPAGGGIIHIGGGKQGRDTSIANAQNLDVDKTALISANATDSGNGGEVVLWSDGVTNADGKIQAKGGPQGGNGGYIETSGETLNLKSDLWVDMGAPLGKGGRWLLDPTFSLIDSSAASSIVTGLLSGEVDNISSTGIEVASAIISSSGNKLSLQATNGQIKVDAVTIQTGGGDIFMGGTTGDSSYATGATSNETGVLLVGSTINAGSGSVLINGKGYTPSDVSNSDGNTTESAGIGVEFFGTVGITGSTVTINGQGGRGQNVTNTTGQTGTVSCDGDFSCASKPASNGASVNGGDGNIGVGIDSSTNVTITASSSATINATGGNGGSGSFQFSETGGVSADGGSGANGYVQQGSMAFDAPTATISGSRGFGGGSGGAGYWVQFFVDDPQPDTCDGMGNCTPNPDLTGHQLEEEGFGGFDDNDGNYGLYFNGNISNTNGVGSILNLESNYRAFQNSGALTASHVMMQGGGSSDSDFDFSQSGNAIDMLAAHSIDDLHFNDNNSGAQPLHIGTVSGVAGVNVSGNSFIQVQSAGGATNPVLVEDSGAQIVAGDDNIITANTMQFNGSNSTISGDTVNLRPYTSSRSIVIGNSDPDAGNDLYFATSVLSSKISSSAGWIVIGSGGSGNITLNNALSLTPNISFSAGSGSVALNDNLTTSGTLVMQGAGGLTSSGAITASNLVLIGSGATATLDNASNNVDHVATANSIGTLDFINTGNLSVDDLGNEVGASAWNSTHGSVSTNGIRASNRVYINTTGDLTINDIVSGQGSYAGSPSYTSPANKNVQEAAAVLMVAGGNFHNPGSSSISTAASNRFLVYSNTPQSDGDLHTSFNFKMYAFDYFASGHTDNGNNGFDYDSGLFGRSMPASTAGSGFLYVTQPTLTVTPISQSGTYGDSPSLSTVLNTGYSLSGFIDGDSSSNDTGTPVFTTPATSASPVTNYDISYTQASTGGLTGLVPKLNSVVLGYSVVNSTNTNGYTVNQRPITVTADASQNMYYGDAVPIPTYQITSGNLVNTSGNGALSGNLVTDATSASNVGTGYTITQGTLANGNYNITYSGTNFTVNQRPLTITPSGGQSKTVGSSDPVFTYGASFTGNGSKPALVNGNTFTGALTRDMGENIGNYGLFIGTLAISDGNGGNNYVITFTPNIQFAVNPVLNTSSLTSAQTGITGTGVTSTLASTTAAATVGPGTGSASINAGATNQVITDNTGTPPPGSPPPDQPPSGQNDPLTPQNNATGNPPAAPTTFVYGNGPNAVTVTQSPGVTSVTLSPEAFTLPNGQTISTPPSLPVFVSGANSGNYNVAQRDTTITATRTGVATIPQPTDTVLAGPLAKTNIGMPDGSSIEITLGISASGVLVIQVPGDFISTINPEATMLMAWIAANKEFGGQVQGITAIVIAPSDQT